MHKLRLLIVSLTILVALFVGSGVASAGLAWSDSVTTGPGNSGIARSPSAMPAATQVVPPPHAQFGPAKAGK